jgi:hypothetical protein
MRPPTSVDADHPLDTRCVLLKSSRCPWIPKYKSERQRHRSFPLGLRLPSVTRERVRAALSGKRSADMLKHRPVRVFASRHDLAPLFNLLGHGIKRAPENGRDGGTDKTNLDRIAVEPQADAK